MERLPLEDEFDHPHLHRDDFQLLAGFLTNNLLGATAFAGQFVRGRLVDDFDAGQLGQQRLALSTTLARRNDFCLDLSCRSFRRWFDQSFGAVEVLRLRRVRVGTLHGLTAEQPLHQ